MDDIADAVIRSFERYLRAAIALPGAVERRAQHLGTGCSCESVDRPTIGGRTHPWWMSLLPALAR
jgi:hypothetical protein